MCFHRVRQAFRELVEGVQKGENEGPSWDRAQKSSKAGWLGSGS